MYTARVFLSLKKWAILGLFFSLLSSFQYTVDSKQMFNKYIIFSRWLDSNRGPLVSEVTAQPNEPQPLPTRVFPCGWNCLRHEPTVLSRLLNHRLLLLKLDKQTHSHLVVEVCNPPPPIRHSTPPSPMPRLLQELAGRWCHLFVCLVLTMT